MIEGIVCIHQQDSFGLLLFEKPLYNAVALCARRIACDPDYLSSISIISVFNFTSSRIAAIVCMPSLQVESAIHATQKLFRKDETEAVLLVDADNAFNH